jgi:hypothetical protein
LRHLLTQAGLQGTRTIPARANINIVATLRRNSRKFLRPKPCKSQLKHANHSMGKQENPIKTGCNRLAFVVKAHEVLERIEMV